MNRVRVLLLLAGLLPLVCPPADARAQANDPKVVGKWGAVMDWPNVGVHSNVLPSGKVLFWGRREWANGHPVPNDESSLDVHDCTPRVWDPSKTGAAAFSPTGNKPGYNLFCSGHTFLGDGRLLVAGGHLQDAKGVDRASVYDYRTDRWSAVPAMPFGGRWYPTAITLPDGKVLVSGGSRAGNDMVIEQLVFDPADAQHPWTKRGEHRDIPYYPRMHVASDGTVFMSGELPLTQFLNANGDWTFLVPGDFDRSCRKQGLRQYAPSVLYDTDKVMYVGGRNVPTNKVELADMKNRAAGWVPARDMNFPRVQHNATILPDGTVLVTGGTRGQGGKPEANGQNNGFNDLRPGQPTHAPELWDPKSNQWTKMAEESVDRCYHSTAVLLPDATVLSAGGGEYRPDQHQNDPVDSKRSAQVYSPPYLFKGPRPQIDVAPEEVKYADPPFTVTLKADADVKQVTWVRLSSVTHAFNSNQRINFLQFTKNGQVLKVTPPAGPNLCPPGHYMLFVLNNAGVPSTATVIRIHG